MKLQYKFAGVIFGIGGIFLLAISVMYFIEAREGDIHSQQLLFEQSAQERAEHIGITFKEKAHIAAVLSRSNVVISSLTASNAQFSGLDTDKRRVEIKRLDAAWIQAKNEDDPFVRPYMTNAVAEFFREHERAFPGEYGEIFLTNKYGVIVAATKKLTTLAHAHKYWWIAAYNGGKGRVFFDDRGYDMSAKGYVIGVTIPVVKDGEVIGILKCNHDVTATLSRIVNSFRPGSTGRLMVVRGKGKIVLTPGVKPLSSDAPLTLVEKMNSRASGSLILNEGGVQTLTAYAPIKMANGEGEYGFGGTADSIDHLLGNRGEQWFVVISQSMEEAITQSYERTREIAWTGIVLIALMGLSAMYFGGRMALPVTRMEKYARRIGGGDYDIPVEPTPGDEMGNLASAFNQMAINLQTTTTSRDKLAEEVERRKEAEEKFKESEQRFRRLAEATFEGITISEKGQFLDTNRAFLDMFGYETVDDVIGKNAVELVAPEYRETVAANIAAGYEKPYEIIGARKDGSFFPIEIRARMMEIPGRRIRVTAIRDITERKKAEEKLAVAHKELESIIEAQPDILYVINMKGELVKWNSALEKLCGLSPEMMMKRPAAEFVCEEDRPTVYDGTKEVFEKGSASIEARFIRGDGALVPHLCNGAVWKSPGGETLGFIGVGKDITERKKAEDSLRRSAQDVRGLLDATEESLLLVEPDGVVIALNETAARRFRKKSDEIVGKDIYDFMPPESAQVRRKMGAEAIRTRAPITFEDERNGRTMRSTLWPVVDSQSGEVVRVGVFSIDVTERHKWERELQENRALLRSTLDSLMDAVFVLDATTVEIKEINKAATDIFGYPADEFIGKTTGFLHVSPESLDAFRKELYPAIERQGYLHLYDFKMKRRDGSIFPTENSVFPLNDEQGRRVAWVSVVRDISKVMEAEKALLESENKYRALVEETNDWVWELNGNGVFTYSSPQVREITGYGAEEISGKTPFDYMRPEEARRVVEFFRATVATQGPFKSFENSTLHKDGYEVVLETSGAPYFSADGRFVGYRGINRDITGRKLSERKLVESEKKFRALFEEMVAGFALNKMIFDEQGNPVDYITIEVNREFERILNATRESVVGKKAYEAVPGLDRKWLDIFGKVALTGASRSYEEYVPHLNKWLEGTVFRPQEGLVAGTFIDITDRKRAEKENAAHIRYLTGVNQVYREFEPELDLETVLPVALNKLLSIFDCDRAFLLYPLDADTKTYKIPFEQTKPEYPGAFTADKELPVTKEVSEIFRIALGASAPVSMNLVEGITDESELKGFDIKTQLVAPLYPKTGKPWMIGLHQCSRVREWTKEDQALFHAISLVISDKLNNLLLVKNLSESETRFRLVADSAPVLIWMSGPDAKCYYFNKGWLDFTGRPLEDELGDGWAQGVHPHDRTRCVDLYMAAFDARSKFSIVYRLHRKDGQYRWVLDNGIPRFSPAGDFMGYIGSCIDITDRKKAEESLARSEKKIRDITAVIGQGVYALDAAGRLAFMNPEAERLLGWTEAEVLGLDIHRRFHGKREDGSIIKRGECPAHKALGTGQPQLLDGELLTKKDGGTFPASIVATPMMDDGRVAGVVVVFSDITERQRIMREITEAKEQAEEATKLKDKFVSLVAHDLKSPFTGIIGLLQVMRENEAHPLDEQNRDIVTHVLQSGRQMLRMIDDLLDISRLKTGKIKPQPRFFDGSVAAGMALARVSQQAAGKGVNVTNGIPSGTRLYADLNLFDEVLQNLLTNAVKFSARGGVVTVFSPGDGIVAVRDTGVGIKKKFLPFLFRHEEKTTTPGTAGELGTGLGLPLSHDLMTAMGGDLAVESEEGAGSVFYASFPCVSPVALIVDDQAPVRYLLRQHLDRIGVRVVEAEDGEQALSLIGEARPNLVVTDISMPKMNGFDLLAAIRKNPETASMPVMMITADNQVESREKAFRMGADDFVSKPIRAEDLIPRVRRFVG